MSLFYYQKILPMPDCDFYVTGVGSREAMNCIINHQRGTDDYLLVYFYDRVNLKRGDVIGEALPGTLVLYESCSPHYYGLDSRQWSHSWLNFHGHAVPELLAEAGIRPGSEFHLESSVELEQCLEQIYGEVVLGDLCNLDILKHIFGIICHQISRLSKLQKQIIVPEHLRRVKNELDRNFNKEIALQEMAKMACFSVPHFCAEFKKFYNCSPVAYRTGLRIESAKHLLQNHNLQIKDIANECGWSDYFQFSKIFRRHVGCSPGEFRLGYFNSLARDGNNHKK